LEQDGWQVVIEGCGMNCRWCGTAFAPRRGGSPQTFCRAACRHAYHKAARQQCEREIAAGWLTVEAIRNGAAAAYTLSERDEQPSPLRDIGPRDAAFPDAQARFVVEIPVATIQGRVGLRWLRADQQNDLGAIMTALRRLGRDPAILHVT
jgi:hypothetical protein